MKVSPHSRAQLKLDLILPSQPVFTAAVSPNSTNWTGSSAWKPLSDVTNVTTGSRYDMCRNNGMEYAATHFVTNVQSCSVSECETNISQIEICACQRRRYVWQGASNYCHFTKVTGQWSSLIISLWPRIPSGTLSPLGERGSGPPQAIHTWFSC